MGIPIDITPEQILDEPEFDAQGIWRPGADWSIAGGVASYAQNVGGYDARHMYQSIDVGLSDYIQFEIKINVWNLQPGNWLQIRFGGTSEVAGRFFEAGTFNRIVSNTGAPVECRVAPWAPPIAGDTLEIEYIRAWECPDVLCAHYHFCPQEHTKYEAFEVVATGDPVYRIANWLDHTNIKILIEMG